MATTACIATRADTYLFKVTFSSSLEVSVDHVFIRAGFGDNAVNMTLEINKALATYHCPPVSDLTIQIGDTSNCITGYQTLKSIGFSPKTNPKDMVNSAVAFKAGESRKSDCLIL
ncbi:hypothetical protein IWQ57_003038 [Coemansia nantahalensis]|uniref:Uncharacterized protein n=1 Tax=Coemansia nantahalensis TaxID=2789366 RepID=A0ACC1JY24_9FUNG|nr:hypothetical protein IWQ57_003038 [Coemansia nantahalensis]